MLDYSNFRIFETITLESVLWIYLLLLSCFAFVYFLRSITNIPKRTKNKYKIKSVALFAVFFIVFLIEATRNIVLNVCIVFVVLYSITLFIVFIQGIRQKMNEKNSRSCGLDSELPEITILFPMKNEEKVICQSLDKIFEVDYPQDKIDVVVIDDHSTDNTVKVLEEYAKSKYITILMNEGPAGKASALNYAIRTINSEYLLILDADHMIQRDFIKKGLSLFDSSDVALVQGMHTIRNGNKSIMAKIVEFEFYAVYHLYHYTKKTQSFLGTSAIFKMDALRDVGDFNMETPSEDWEISLRFHQKGYKIQYCNEISTFELGTERLKDFLTQRYRWMRGIWFGMDIQFRNMMKATNVPIKNKIDFISSGFLPLALSSYFIINFFIAFSFFGVTDFPISINLYLIMHIPFLLFHALGLIFAKKYLMIPLIFIAPIYSLIYSFSAFDATFDHLILNSYNLGDKTDRSKMKDL